MVSERPGVGQSENDAVSLCFREKQIGIKSDKQLMNTCGFGQAGRGASENDMSSHCFRQKICIKRAQTYENTWFR